VLMFSPMNFFNRLPSTGLTGNEDGSNLLGTALILRKTLTRRVVVWTDWVWVLDSGRCLVCML
jgi:hypothetical protein